MCLRPVLKLPSRCMSYKKHRKLKKKTTEMYRWCLKKTSFWITKHVANDVKVEAQWQDADVEFTMN